MNRRALALVAGVALPTVLLGAGWLTASLREQEALIREQEQILVRRADAVRGAVDESLEELRLREDRRPFYLYNPLYSPPPEEVIALNDPLVASPLAADPDDDRILGYFQLDPAGVVRTPYAETGEGMERSKRGRRITSLVGKSSFDPLRALAYVPDSLTNPDQPSPLLAAMTPSTPGNVEALIEGETSPSIRSRPTQRVRPRSPSSTNTNTISDAYNTDLAPQGPLTTNLSAWNREVFDDIQQAQAGSAEASSRVQRRGRAAPSTRRNTIQWQEVVDNSQAPLPNQVQLSGTESMSQESVRTKQQRPPRQQRSNRPRRPRKQAGATEPTPQPTPPQPSQIDVGYTPMAWGLFGDGTVVLHRVVSHGGTGVVQGVILDREYLVDEWIPSLIQRHVATMPPQVVDGGSDEDVDCAIRRQASALLDNVDLCYSPEAVAAVTAVPHDNVSLQVSALAGLVLIVTLAGLAMYRATGRAEELSRQKSAFVSSVSHELRTPLTTIRMHAEMLREGLVPEAKRDRFHGQLVHEAVRLSHLVENVLELSRLEEGRRVLRPQLGDLRAAVAGTVAEHRPFVEEKGFTLHGPSESEPLTLAFDTQAVSQIVINLVDNAVKYGSGAEARVDVDVILDEDLACISVRDRGGGIPEDERDRVFERFHRIQSPEKAHMPGTGIGLSLVRELARAHGGDAEIRSAQGGGCEVRVFFPRDHAMK